MTRKNTNWEKVLPSIKELSKPQLIELISDLHDTCPEASLFLGGRFGKTKILLKPYVEKVKEAASADPIYDEGINWVGAERAIHNYKIASGDNKGVAELLILYVDTANQFTLEYGDIDEGYYESMEEIFQDAVDHLLLMEKEHEPIDDFVERLEEIVDSTSDIGWGYHDSLCDMYHEAFNK
jgi:hypothetical protein